MITNSTNKTHSCVGTTGYDSVGATIVPIRSDSFAAIRGIRETEKGLQAWSVIVVVRPGKRGSRFSIHGDYGVKGSNLFKLFSSTPSPFPLPQSVKLL